MQVKWASGWHLPPIPWELLPFLVSLWAGFRKRCHPPPGKVAFDLSCHPFRDVECMLPPPKSLKSSQLPQMLGGLHMTPQCLQSLPPHCSPKPFLVVCLADGTCQGTCLMWRLSSRACSALRQTGGSRIPHSAELICMIHEG